MLCFRPPPSNKLLELTVGHSSPLISRLLLFKIRLNLQIRIGFCIISIYTVVEIRKRRMDGEDAWNTPHSRLRVAIEIG
jgi:hypothetical protein